MAEPLNTPTTQRLRTSGRAARRQRVRAAALPRTLPTVRAVVGAMLCVAAALVAWFGATSAKTAAPIPVVVAARSIPAGVVIRADDLRVSPMALPSALERRTFRSAGPVVGSITVGPTAAGDPLLPGALAPGGPAAGHRQVSLLLPTAAAVGGQLRSGDRVDVLATTDAEGGEPSRTETVATAVLVSEVDDPSVGVTTTATERMITFALDDSVDPVRFVHAAATATVHLVRVTGTGPTTNDPR